MARTPEKKTLAQYEKQRARRNETQKRYRRENPEICEIWKQRSYCNYLRKRGWKVVEPEGFPTLEEVHTKRDLLRQLEGAPVDLSEFGPEDFDFDIGPDEWPFP